MATIVSVNKTSSNDDAYFRSPRIEGIHGVLHMSSRPNGDIFWKGTKVARLSNVMDIANYEVLQERGLLCRHLERLGIPVNMCSVGSHRRWFSTMKINEPYKELLGRCPEIYVGSDKLLIRFRHAACEFDGKGWLYYILGSADWKARWHYNDLEKMGYSYRSLTSCELSEVLQCLKYFDVPDNLLDVMSLTLNPRICK